MPRGAFIAISIPKAEAAAARLLEGGVVAGVEAVVNGVSLLLESGQETFHSVHVTGAARVARLAREARVRQLSPALARMPDPPRHTFAAEKEKWSPWFCGASETHVQAYTKPLLEKITAGKIDPSFVVTHPTNLENAPEMYQKFRDKEDGVKVVLRPGN